MPSRGASGRMNWVGSTMRVPAPGSQGSTPGIRVLQLVEAQVVGAGDVDERVLVAGADHLHFADHVAARG